MFSKKTKKETKIKSQNTRKKETKILKTKPTFFNNFIDKKKKNQLKKGGDDKLIQKRKRNKKKIGKNVFGFIKKRNKNKKKKIKKNKRKRGTIPIPKNIFLNLFRKRKNKQKPKKTKKRKAPDFPCFKKINWEKVSYFTIWSSYAMMVLIIIFLLGQIIIFSLIAETNGHINKLYSINQKIENHLIILQKDFDLLQDHTLNLTERKKVMQDLRELDEDALEAHYEVVAYQNDLSVNLWEGSHGFLSQTFTQARQLELAANRFSQKMTYLAFVGRVNSFQIKLTQKDFDLLQDKIIFIKSRLQAAGL